MNIKNKSFSQICYKLGNSIETEIFSVSFSKVYVLMRNKIVVLSLFCFMIEGGFTSYFSFVGRALYFTSVINYILGFQFSTLLEIKHWLEKGQKYLQD